MARRRPSGALGELTQGEWERTFVVITVPSNELVSQIHDRMPAILKPESYDRWLGLDPAPHDLLITYPSEPMTMWPISTRVNKPENDDPSILDRASRARGLAGSPAAKLSSVRRSCRFSKHLPTAILSVRTAGK
jgi:hypothetical protein